VITLTITLSHSSFHALPSACLLLQFSLSQTLSLAITLSLSLSVSLSLSLSPRYPCTPALVCAFYPL